ncbi:MULTISPECIES: cell wall metabolism sensor histidine kinase WalK [unclassified Nocardia]|uniref:sensor histidine kinase n=1 Tax=unclassified Nocardia TaxID=2637762 RepID=UPI00278C1B35|nr:MULTISPECIES: HAMP domain-containing sensor histidine kinase [unclassified Nocardia]
MIGRRWTLRFRLLLAVVLVAATGVAAFGVIAVVLLERAQRDRIDTQLALVVADLAGPDRPNPPPDTGSGVQVPSDFRIVFFEPDGTQVARLGAPDATATMPALPAMDDRSVRERGDAPFTVADQRTDTRWRVRTAVQDPTPARTEGGTLAVALSLRTAESTTARLRTIELVTGTTLLVLLLGIAAVSVRVGLRPLTRIERTARAIADGDLDRRVADTDPHTEVGRLGTTFNTMLTRLDTTMRRLTESEQRMRAFVADASHELRTPLTSIRGFAELHRHGTPDVAQTADMMRRIEAEAVRMSAMVDDLLLLAQFDEERPLDLTDVDLTALAHDVVCTTRARAPERRLELLAPPDHRHVTGDAHRLRRVLVNLVGNALTHTPPDTRVTVVIADEPDSLVPDAPLVAEAGAASPPRPRLIVEVRDDGPGIAAGRAAHVFDRFYRADPARSGTGGTGLGLAIVAAILSAHDAGVQLYTAPGAGTVFRVLVPTAAAQRRG